MGNQQGSLINPDWMIVPGQPGYYVDAEGRIISVNRGKVKYLSPCLQKARGKKPYLRVKLGGKTHLAHRIVLSAMIGRVLFAEETGNHKNGDTTFNHPSNLEVMSHRENTSHAMRSGLYCSGDRWYAARGMLKS